MLHAAAILLVTAIVSALCGFGAIAAGAVGIAQVLFFIFLATAVVSFVLGLLKESEEHRSPYRPT
jgi:uncharacterized membrane protein YtjA (UPF0391 family)